MLTAGSPPYLHLPRGPWLALLHQARARLGCAVSLSPCTACRCPACSAVSALSLLTSLGVPEPQASASLASGAHVLSPTPAQFRPQVFPPETEADDWLA